VSEMIMIIPLTLAYLLMGISVPIGIFYDAPASVQLKAWLCWPLIISLIFFPRSWTERFRLWITK